MRKITLKIYIAGPSTRNSVTIDICKNVCTEKFKGKAFEVKIIDVLKNPGEAEKKKILATPTITRERPTPEKRIIGELRDMVAGKKAIEFLMDDLIN